jgi:hypothetical protein
VALGREVSEVKLANLLITARASVEAAELADISDLGALFSIRHAFRALAGAVLEMTGRRARGEECEELAIAEAARVLGLEPAQTPPDTLLDLLRRARSLDLCEITPAERAAALAALDSFETQVWAWIFERRPDLSGLVDVD